MGDEGGGKVILSLMAFYGLYITFFILVTNSTEEAVTPPISSAPENALDAISSAFDILFWLFQHIFNAMVFSIPGCPWFIQFPIALMVNVPLAYGVYMLVMDGMGKILQAV